MLSAGKQHRKREQYISMIHRAANRRTGRKTGMDCELPREPGKGVNV
jgi:hypothetical protein